MSLPIAALSDPLAHPALALLAVETTLRRGAVLPHLHEVRPDEGFWTMSRDAFLFHAQADVRFFYRRGRGIIVDAPPATDPRDIALWHHGTVYSAVAALNGFYPLHASAVAYGGKVFAFTGPPGAGKSTIVAALGKASFAHFCDDTLLLDLSGEGPPQALPGHKRLKLWPAGVALAQVEPRGLVAEDYEKHFVDPSAPADRPLPLAELAVLAEGAVAAFSPLSLGEKIAVLDDEHQTVRLWLAANGMDRGRRFAELSTLTRRIRMTRFTRPFEPSRFADGLATAAAHIREIAP